jgi:hypothetical protein
MDYDHQDIKFKKIDSGIRRDPFAGIDIKDFIPRFSNSPYYGTVRSKVKRDAEDTIFSKNAFE